MRDDTTRNIGLASPPPTAVNVTPRRKMSKSKHALTPFSSGSSNGRTIPPAKHIQREETAPKIEPNTSPQSISSSLDPIEVPDLSSSPYRIKASFKLMENADIDVIKPPSSPMLTAMREAVDSITKYEDFEIVEKIGAGFYADVFKVVNTDANLINRHPIVLCVGM